MAALRKAQPVEFWNVVFKVRPSAEHPTFTEDQAGVVGVFLTAPDRQTAVQRALVHLSMLPFESTGDEVLTATLAELRAGGALPADVDQMLEIVRASGLHVSFEPEIPV